MPDVGAKCAAFSQSLADPGMRRLLARQLAHPTGLAGRMVGWMMKLANRAPTRLAIDALCLKSGDRVLDLGCGPGQAAALMLPLSRPGRVVGIDQSRTMIDQAARDNRRAVAAGEMAFHVARFDALPFETASFEAVLASNVMYFWQDTQAVLTEIRRVLAPGGRLTLYVTAAESMAGWGFVEAGTHRLFSAADVAEALTAGGFPEAAVDVCEVALGKGVTGIVATAHLPRADTGILQAA